MAVQELRQPRLKDPGFLALQLVQSTQSTLAVPVERWVFLVVAAEERGEAEAHCSLRQLDWVRRVEEDRHQSH